VDLKFLRLDIREYISEFFNVIWEMKNLESLELAGWTHESDNLNNLHRLENLKRLKVDQFVSSNILDHMKFGVFQNLEELDGYFKEVSLESVLEMKRITPNLKKIVICSATSKTTNALLETLENLEAVKIGCYNWRLTEKVYPKIKYLEVSSLSEEYTKLFPNLKYLGQISCDSQATESFFITLFSTLKQLKSLYMGFTSAPKLRPKSALQCLQQHGNHLEDAHIIFWIPKVPAFAIEKRPGAEFCINKRRISDRPSWMREAF
jgi:hypothetical protein